MYADDEKEVVTWHRGYTSSYTYSPASWSNASACDVLIVDRADVTVSRGTGTRVERGSYNGACVSGNTALRSRGGPHVAVCAGRVSASGLLDSPSPSPSHRMAVDGGCAAVSPTSGDVSVCSLACDSAEKRRYRDSIVSQMTR